MYLMYRIWTACNILGIKAEQFRGINHQKDTAFICDTIFRCIALGLNCDYMTFYRTDVLIGRKFLKVDFAAVELEAGTSRTGFVKFAMLQLELEACTSRTRLVPQRFSS